MAVAGLVMAWVILGAQDPGRVEQEGNEVGAAHKEDDPLARQDQDRQAGSARVGLEAASETASDIEAIVGIDPCRLEGRVVRQADGTPVAGARVQLLHRDADEFVCLDLEYGQRVRILAEATTDERGRFGFDVARGLQHRLKATKEGFAARTSLSAVGGSEVVIRLGRGAMVSGQVTGKEDGRPIPGAGIRITVSGESPHLGETRTGADGRYRLTDLPAETVYALCFAPHQGVPVGKQLDIVAGGKHVVDFELESGRSVTGVVTDASTGKPIPGAHIATVWSFQPHVETDGVGRFAVVVPKASHYQALYVRTEGYVQQAEPIPLELERIDIALHRGGSIKGRVIDGNGAGIPEAYVAAGASYRMRVGMSHADWIRAEVDRNGFFQAVGLDAHRDYWLYLRAPGRGARMYRLPRRLAEGEVLDVGDLRLLAAGGSRGRSSMATINRSPGRRSTSSDTTRMRSRCSDPLGRLPRAVEGVQRCRSCISSTPGTCALRPTARFGSQVSREVSTTSGSTDGAVVP
ncbi:MAG: carboxypeptidase-like regulatory domain-containing protein [Planctomycetota bacterium]